MGNNILGTNIKKARQNLGITQKKFASLCDISSAHLCKIEAGTRIPSVQTLKRISYFIPSDLSETLEQAGYSNDAILEIKDSSSISFEEKMMPLYIQQKFFNTYIDLSDEDKSLFNNFCSKLSKLSPMDKSFIRLLLNSTDA